MSGMCTEYAFFTLVAPNPWHGKRSVYNPFEFVRLVSEKGTCKWLSILKKEKHNSTFVSCIMRCALWCPEGLPQYFFDVHTD